LIVPARDKRTADATAIKPLGSFIAEGSQDRWCARVRGLSRSIRSVKMNSVGQEQDHRRMLPDGLEPLGLCSRVQQRNAVTVLRELGDPRPDLESVVRRI
jgi:hypothetical protein